MTSRPLKQLTQLALHPRRFMRSRGHGVHSPFAFSFICSVIGEHRCGYYAYGRINQLAAATQGRVAAADLQLLFRMVCALRPASFKAVGAGASQAEACVRMAMSNIEVAPHGAAELWWINGDDPGATDEFARALETGLDVEGLLVGAPHCAGAVPDHLKSGMIFTSGNKTIVVSRKHLPRQDYSIIF